MIWSKCLYSMLGLHTQNLDQLQPQREARREFFKEKAQGLWGDKGEVRLLFFWVIASGFQDVSQDNGLGQEPGCFQVQEGQSDHQLLWLPSGLYCGSRERVSIKPWAIKRVEITESWAVEWVRKLVLVMYEQTGGLGNWPDPFNRVKPE